MSLRLTSAVYKVFPVVGGSVLTDEEGAALTACCLSLPAEAATTLGDELFIGAVVFSFILSTELVLGAAVFSFIPSHL